MKQLIRKILKEETEGMSPLEQTVADFVNMNLSEYDLPEDFDRVAVDIYSDGYGRQECVVTSLFKKPFTLEESDMLHSLMRTIKKSIEEYFGNTFSYVRGSTSTTDSYMDTKWWYDQKKNK